LLIFGVIALSYGFGVYYLLPLSMVSFNFSLAMSLFFSILFGMIFSLAVIGINLMPYINEMLKHKGLHSIQIGRMNLPILEIETFLK